MESKVLIFDFDGTIADSSDLAVEIYNRIAVENNFRQISKDDLMSLRASSAMENMKSFGVPLLKLPFIVKKVRAGLKSQMKRMKAFEGMPEALRLLKQRGCQLFIISTNSKDNIREFLDHNGIHEFDAVFQVSAIFGKHARIASLVKSNGWNPESVVYIGDEIRDIAAAKKAGVRPVAVAWGYNTADALADHQPDALLYQPSELIAL